MTFTAETEQLLTSLDNLSGGKLRHRNQLGILVECAQRSNQQETLDDLSFQAKFAARTYGIMKRVGPGGDGYDRLTAAFTESVAKATGFMQSLLQSAPDQTREEFSGKYLSQTHEGLEDLLGLFQDLSWYKNWQLDGGTAPS